MSTESKEMACRLLIRLAPLQSARFCMGQLVVVVSLFGHADTYLEKMNTGNAETESKAGSVEILRNLEDHSDHLSVIPASEVGRNEIQALRKIPHVES